MMSAGEIISLSIFGLIISGALVTISIWLIKQVMKQSASAAVAEQKANQNAVAITKLEKAAEITASPITVDDVLDRLRDSNAKF